MLDLLEKLFDGWMKFTTDSPRTWPKKWRHLYVYTWPISMPIILSLRIISGVIQIAIFVPLMILFLTVVYFAALYAGMTIEDYMFKKGL